MYRRYYPNQDPVNKIKDNNNYKNNMWAGSVDSQVWALILTIPPVQAQNDGIDLDFGPFNLLATLFVEKASLLS